MASPDYSNTVSTFLSNLSLGQPNAAQKNEYNSRLIITPISVMGNWISGMKIASLQNDLDTKKLGWTSLSRVEGRVVSVCIPRIFCQSANISHQSKATAFTQAFKGLELIKWEDDVYEDVGTGSPYASVHSRMSN